MSKWAKFHSAYSPLQIKKANEGKGIRLDKDWSRAIGYTSDPTQGRQILIDGQPITKYADRYNRFATVENVKEFFEHVILGKMNPTPKEKDKDEIIEFLTKTFHQGGFMNPVSAALATSMERKALPGEDGAREGRIAWGTIKDMHLVVNIIPTKEGFKVKEHVGVKKS